MDRIELHSDISLKLESLKDDQLSALVEAATPFHAGIGGRSVLLSLNGRQVFVKKIPLTDLERRSGNFKSTANIFELPMICQYRVGGPGFGAWREVAAHEMTTKWVLEGECPNFPLLYHWRVLPMKPGSLGSEELQDIEKVVQYWDNSSAVRKRLEERQGASAYVALFLEYQPQNAFQWLNERFAEGGASAESAVRLLDQSIGRTIDFMKANGLTHFDVHFENVLTDGKDFYLSDFGLSLSTEFGLSDSEFEFLRQHRNYDQANATMSLVICILRSQFAKGPWETILRDYIKGQKGELLPALDAIVRRDAPLALALKEFFNKFDKNKSTAYPAEALKRLIQES